MRSFLDRFPLHLALFPLFPVLALYAVNASEVEPSVVLRPILFSLLLSLVVFGILMLIVRKVAAAACMTTFLLAAFLSYGHVYQLVHVLFGLEVGRHRYLAPIYLVILAGLFFLMLWKTRDWMRLNRVLNILSAILLISPLLQISVHSVGTSLSSQAAREISLDGQPLDPQTEPLPDVYYIVLDTYARQDALLDDFGFDNSAFIQSLRDLGFYVADCARSNYSYTQGTMTTALNLEYLPDLIGQITGQGFSENDIWLLLKNSLVRSRLEALGYQTIAFETGYEWSRLADADILFKRVKNPANLTFLEPFELMFLRTTAVRLIMDLVTSSYVDPYSYHPYGAHIAQHLMIFDKLPTVPSIPGPKFVFVHILIPHVPYVFAPDGSIREDPGFFSGENSTAINEEYLQEGYTGEITYLNGRLLAILRTILAESDTPPIIVMHGDHGLRDENRLEIFSAYYLQGRAVDALYPAISPVNSFRLIFDVFFGTSYGLLPDESYDEDDPIPVLETSPACVVP